MNINTSKKWLISVFSLLMLLIFFALPHQYCMDGPGYGLPFPWYHPGHHEWGELVLHPDQKISDVIDLPNLAAALVLWLVLTLVFAKVYRRWVQNRAQKAKRTSTTPLSIDVALGVFLAHSSADQFELLAELVKVGATAPQAWRLHQFLPIAFAHTLFEPAGVRFQPTYLLQRDDHSEQTRHALADEPLYVQARAAAERIARRPEHRADLLKVAGRSAEFGVINDLLGRGSALSDLVLTEPVLFEYAAPAE